MSAGRGAAWIVAASIGAVEALKDQLGFCRWNYGLRSLQQHAKTNLTRSYSQVRILSGPRPTTAEAEAVSGGGRMREEKVKRTEERLRKVMELNCWGPNTIRF